jgi:predicted RNA-binding Zn ribbon-like protein
MSQANFAPYLECSLSLAVDLVNTEDPVSKTDELATVDQLKDFIEEHEISQVSKRPTHADLDKVRALRARLRRVFESQNQDTAVSILNELISETGARPELTNHDGQGWHMHYSPSGTPLAPRLAADAAMALSVVIAQEGYERLRTCEGERCVDVFVDESKNRSRRYCSPNPCGNRASVAAFRARQREHAQHS